MSAEIGRNDVHNFFIQRFNTTNVSFNDIKDLGIDVERYQFADENDDNRFDLEDEVFDIKDFYAAVVAAVEKEKSSVDEAKDADKEKEEKTKIQKKGDAENK